MKPDLGDAYPLADVVRTDGHRFRTLVPLSDETKALRGLVRLRDDLVGQCVGAANQLRNLLESLWPGSAAIFRDVDSPIALDLLDRYPTPQSAASLGQKCMAAFTACHGTAGGAAPSSCSSACVLRRSASPASSRPRPRASACALVAVLRPRWSPLRRHARDAAPLRRTALRDDHVIRSSTCALPATRRAAPAATRSKVATYFRRHRMRINNAVSCDVLIRSGVVEAACKRLVAQRLKLSGMRWGRVDVLR